MPIGPHHPGGGDIREQSLQVLERIAAAAGGAYACTISRPEEVEPALERALEAVRVERRCGVVDARIVQP